MPAIITTSRLVLRDWELQADLESLSNINRDPKVMQYFPSIITKNRTLGFMLDNNNLFLVNGYCLFAVELMDSGELIGFAGIKLVNLAVDFFGEVEIAWRLSSKYWGRGYAFEAGSAIIDYAFATHKLGGLVSYTVPTNLRAIHLLTKLGFVRDLSGDFLHPNIERNNPLGAQILYRLNNELA